MIVKYGTWIGVLAAIICLTIGIIFNWNSQKKIIENSISEQKGTDQFDAPDQFARFHQLIRANADDTISAYPPNYQYEELVKAKERVYKNENYKRDELDWISRGPGNVGGRTRGLVLDSRDPELKTWFLGAVGGGIWRTSDAGETWENLTGELPNLAISWMEQSDSNPEVFYASTGNAFVSRGTNGAGLLKSIDGGESWFILSGTLNRDFTNIYRVSISPEDENEVLVCTQGRKEYGFNDNFSRILKSADGGLNWELKYESTDNVIQQIVHASSDTLFASANGQGVLRSIDAGENWNLIWAPPSGNFGRMELTALGTIVYATVDEDDAADKIYKSFDAGITWFELRRLNGTNISGWLGGQGWFDNTIALYPENPNIIFAAGQSAMIKLETTNSPIGDRILSVFEVITDGYNNYGGGVGSKGVHVDHHNLILSTSPDDGSITILNANDGGVSFSRDGGMTFIQTGDKFKSDDGIEFETLNGYITSQFYGVDKMNGEDRYVGGTQDNGSWVSGTEPGDQSIWRSAPSGDGFESAWNYEDSNLILESSQYNNIYKSFDGGRSWFSVLLPVAGGPFITRIASSKLSPNLVFLSSSEGLLRSADFGDSWDVIEMPIDWRYNSSLGPPIEISLASPRIVWSGARMRLGNNVCLSKDGGVSFSPVNRFPSDSLGRITGIASHPTNEKTAYLLFSIPNAPKVLRTEDYGESWEDLSQYSEESGFHENGYPDVATYSLLVMPHDTNIIWAGTDIGLFESLDNGESWDYANNGLPAAPVWDMLVVNDEIVIATHGRGIWTVSIPELNGYEPVASLGLPQIDADRNFGALVSGQIKLDDPYDSAHFQVDLPSTGEIILERSFERNTQPLLESFSLDLEGKIQIDTILNVELTLTAYDGENTFVEKKKVEVFVRIDTAILDYQNDFESVESKLDFARLGFFVGSPETDLDNGLNTPHFHGSDLFLKSILRQPIQIQETSVLTFDEIVLVEPGDSFDPDNSSFWDYVQVEGTNNRGKTWKRLSRYDSNENENWRDAYDNGDSGTADLIQTKAFDLSAYFETGDEVYFRFSFFSDAFVNGWGWWIDQINFSSGVVKVKEIQQIDADFNMLIYPNPVYDKSNLYITKSTQGLIDIRLIRSDGSIVQSLFSGSLEAGEHNLPINVSGYAAGLYFVQARMEGHVFTKKLIIGH